MQSKLGPRFLHHHEIAFVAQVLLYDGHFCNVLC